MQGDPSPPPPAPAAPEAPTSAPSTEPSAEELLAALGTSSDPAELDLEEPKLNLYGFADFTWFTQVGEKVAYAAQNSTFMVGNFI